MVHLLFKGELEDGVPTSEHVFLYENIAEEETPEVMKGKDLEKGSDNTISDSSSVSDDTSTTAVNNTKKGRGRKKVTNRGSTSSTKIILPRPTKFVPTPGYSV